MQDGVHLTYNSFFFFFGFEACRFFVRSFFLKNSEGQIAGAITFIYCTNSCIFFEFFNEFIELQKQLKRLLRVIKDYHCLLS